MVERISPSQSALLPETYEKSAPLAHTAKTTLVSLGKQRADAPLQALPENRLKNVVQWLQQDVFPKIEEEEKLLKPLLPKANPVDFKQLQELKEELDAVSSIETKTVLSDAALSKLLIEAMKNQESASKKENALDIMRIQTAQQMIRAAQLETHKTIEEIKKNEKLSDALGIASTVITSIAVTGGVLACIFTSGAALPLVMTSLLSVCQGGVLLVKGATDLEGKKGEAKTFELRFQIGEAQREQRLSLKELHKKMQEIDQSVKLVHESLQGRIEVAKQMVKRTR